jgi:hypothetical protein
VIVQNGLSRATVPGNMRTGAAGYPGDPKLALSSLASARQSLSIPEPDGRSLTMVARQGRGRVGAGQGRSAAGLRHVERQPI